MKDFLIGDLLVRAVGMELATVLREASCLSREQDPIAAGFLSTIDAFVDVAISVTLNK